MAKLMHFVKKQQVPGPSEFVYIAEGDPAEVEKEYAENGYELSASIEIDDDELGGLPTERELSP